MTENGNAMTDDEKRGYRRILDGKCELVEDRWFPADGARNAKRKYRKEFKRKERRNRRRRELRRGRELEALSALLPDQAPDDPVGMSPNGPRPDGGSPGGMDGSPRPGGDSPVQKMVKNAQWQLFHRNSYEMLVHPSEVLTLILLFDLVGFLDRVIRRLWRLAVKSGEKADDPNLALEVSRIANGRAPRRSAGSAPLDTEHRLACERRKVLCRSTAAACPTATDIRVAWRFHRRSYEDQLVLGGLMMDLECYLDNSLRREERGRRPLIRGRGPGIRGWLRENCPELEAKYFTLMRWKGMVRRLRQALEVQDPVPTSALLDDTEDTAEIRSRAVQIQARGTVADAEFRFPWEHGEWRTDATGRRFLTNYGYNRAPGWFLDAAHLGRHLAEARQALRKILAAARAAASRSTSRRHSRTAAVHLCREILRRVDEREIWWRGALSPLET